MKDLARRLPTTIVLVVFAYAAIAYLPVPYFAALLYLLVSLAVLELLRLTRPSRHMWPLAFINGVLVALAFASPENHLSLALVGCLLVDGLFFLATVNSRERLDSFARDWGILALTVVYLYFPLYFMLTLKRMDPNLLFFMILVIAIGDSGAYFVGSAIGKHKIYPVASPRKSLEGLIAAVLTAGLSGWLSIVLFPFPVKVPVAMATAAIIGLFSQLSDPVESLFKRAVGQKDSGTLLPGHGGVLDRIDSYIFCAPLLYILVMYLW
ncbi:MAG: phosphatidate cytidylyltransferase [Candidatus Aminicenantes bacterium]|nr:phosphatidate cytidylyltransferase [Candidatus Aminicenantes bacterium]